MEADTTGSPASSGAGSCLFKSLLFKLNPLFPKGAKDTLTLRKTIMMEIEENDDEYMHFITIPWEDYLTNMSREIHDPSCWGGEPEIRACADVFDCSITIWRSDLKEYFNRDENEYTYKIWPQCTSGLSRIQNEDTFNIDILYNGCHYENLEEWNTITVSSIVVNDGLDQYRKQSLKGHKLNDKFHEIMNIIKETNEITDSEDENEEKVEYTYAFRTMMTKSQADTKCKALSEKLNTMMDLIDLGVPRYSNQLTDTENLDVIKNYVNTLEAEELLGELRFHYYTFVYEKLTPELEHFVLELRNSNDFWEAQGITKPHKWALKSFCRLFMGENYVQIYDELRCVTRTLSKTHLLIRTEKDSLIELHLTNRYTNIPTELQHFYRTRNIVDMERLIGNVEAYKKLILKQIGAVVKDHEENKDDFEPFDEEQYEYWKASIYRHLQSSMMGLSNKNAKRFMEKLLRDLRMDYKQFYTLLDYERNIPIEQQQKKLLNVPTSGTPMEIVPTQDEN